MERASVILEKARRLAPRGRDRELSVLLLYVGGYSPVEVAEVLGLSHDTKKVLLDHSLYCWRREKDFKEAYDAGVVALSGDICPACGR